MKPIRSNLTSGGGGTIPMNTGAQQTGLQLLRANATSVVAPQPTAPLAGLPLIPKQPKRKLLSQRALGTGEVQTVKAAADQSFIGRVLEGLTRALGFRSGVSAPWPYKRIGGPAVGAVTGAGVGAAVGAGAGKLLSNGRYAPYVGAGLGALLGSLPGIYSMAANRNMGRGLNANVMSTKRSSFFPSQSSDGYGIPILRMRAEIATDPLLSPFDKAMALRTVDTAAGGQATGVMGWQKLADAAVQGGVGYLAAGAAGRLADTFFGGVSRGAQSKLKGLGLVAGIARGLFR